MELENPLESLYQAMAHAEYIGFSDIEQEIIDWKHYRDTGEQKRTFRKRRPSVYDFNVYAMFPQTWGSTALGHGGMGGAAMTPAYTIVLECMRTNEFLVYFGGRFCYCVKCNSKNIETFIEDCKNQNLASKKESFKYG